MAEIKVSARLHHSGGSVVGGSLFLASLASNGCFTPVSVSVVTLPALPSVSSLPLPPSYQHLESTQIIPDNLLISNSSTESHLQPYKILFTCLGATVQTTTTISKSLSFLELQYPNLSVFSHLLRYVHELHLSIIY